MVYTLPTLNFKYSDLDPYIDAETMEIHYTKHHQTYVNSLISTVEVNKISAINLTDLIKNLKKRKDLDENVKNQLINFGGGHYNHSFFWMCLSSKNNDNTINSNFFDAIKQNFGGIDNFKNEFFDKALKLFGSGWVWLIYKDGKLFCETSINQDNPMMVDANVIPLLCLDVWEHAYYLKYKNNRSLYVKNWWSIINWEFVSNVFINCCLENNKIIMKNDGSVFFEE